MVAMLFAVEHVQAIQRRAASRAVEPRVDVRARERPTGREGERDVVTVARLRCLNRTDMKRATPLPLNPVMLQRGAVADAHFSDRVREIRRLADCHVALE